MAKVEDALGTDYVFRPFGIYEIVEFLEIERRTAIIYECTYAVFLRFPMLVVMMMMVVMTALFLMDMMLVVMPMLVVMSMLVVMLMLVTFFMAVRMRMSHITMCMLMRVLLPAAAASTVRMLLIG